MPFLSLAGLSFFADFDLGTSSAVDLGVLDFLTVTGAASSVAIDHRLKERTGDIGEVIVTLALLCWNFCSFRWDFFDLLNLFDLGFRH